MNSMVTNSDSQLAQALKAWLVKYDPEEFGCACMPEAPCSTCRWRDRIAPLQKALAAWEAEKAGGYEIVWPKARDVGRLEDMSPDGHLRVGLDGDGDVYLSIYNGGDEPACANVEFCVPGSGGGKSSRTRLALIELMLAMEADNAEDPSRDWWALRNPEGAASRAVGGERAP